MVITEYFKTPIFSENKIEFVKSLNKNSNKYIKEARQKNKNYTEKFSDFGISHHSKLLMLDKDFSDFINYISIKSLDFLECHGFDIELYTVILTELWVQEFSKKGGGHHSTHLHSNQHVSGFYFLKCSEKTAHPIFYDPRLGARMIKLKMKNKSEINYGSEKIHFFTKPGDLIIFPSYLDHEFSIDYGMEPFRFIHFNLQAVEKKNNKKFMKFKINKYVIVKNVITKDLSLFLYNYLIMKKQVYDTCLSKQYISPFETLLGYYENSNQQIPNTYSCYADISMETLLLKIQPIMEKKTGLKLNPSYTYTRIYKKGDILHRHKDRFSCEISATMNLGGDDWPIYLEPSGKKDLKGIKVNLKSGDMLIYRGCELEHWREKFEGNECVQVFLHYNDVKSIDTEKNMFDQRLHLGLPAWFKMKQ